MVHFIEAYNTKGRKILLSQNLFESFKAARKYARSQFHPGTVRKRCIPQHYHEHYVARYVGQGANFLKEILIY